MTSQKFTATVSSVNLAKCFGMTKLSDTKQETTRNQETKQYFHT